MYRITVIEDDDAIYSLLARSLSEWGFEVMRVTDYGNAPERLLSQMPHLVLLDVMLPGINGCALCAKLRKSSGVPVIFISSAGEKSSVLTAISLGGDDFIVKPFDFDVLLAKINALLRRTYDFAAPEELTVCGGGRLRAQEGVFEVKGREGLLTRNELRLLQTLLARRGKIVSRQTLMQKLWETDSFVDENTLSVNINRLRKKLAQAGAEDFILTKIGMGYYIPAEGAVGGSADKEHE